MDVHSDNEAEKSEVLQFLTRAHVELLDFTIDLEQMLTDLDYLDRSRPKAKVFQLELRPEMNCERPSVLISKSDKAVAIATRGVVQFRKPGLVE